MLVVVLKPTGSRTVRSLLVSIGFFWVFLYFCRVVVLRFGGVIVRIRTSVGRRGLATGISPPSGVVLAVLSSIRPRSHFLGAPPWSCLVGFCGHIRVCRLSTWRGWVGCSHSRARFGCCFGCLRVRGWFRRLFTFAFVFSDCRRGRVYAVFAAFEILGDVAVAPASWAGR